MTVRLLLASGNAKKLTELRRIIAGVIDGKRFELIGLRDVTPYPEPVESGLTFAENALLKAREAARHSGLPSLADDSGLAVDALSGMPGVFSARWAGRHGDDEANLRLVLGQLSDVADTHRGAAFVCAAALATADGREYVVEGRLTGHLVREPRGDNGFGYDPIFVPEGDTRTTAQLTPREKDAISHRGRAFRSLARIVADELG